MSGGLCAAGEKEQQTKTIRISVIKDQSTEIIKSKQLELSFQQTSQYRLTIIPHHTYKHYMQWSLSID